MLRRSRFLVATVSIALATSGAAEEARRAGEGVLCAYGFYAGALVDAKWCGWLESANGKAIESIVSDIETFISANSSDPTIVPATHENIRGGEVIWSSWAKADQMAYCEGSSQEHPNYFIPLRTASSEELLESAKAMLAKPGEPTYGTCY